MVYERVVKRFYDELENGKIMGRKCTRCNAVEYPPRFICNSCGNLETEWVELSGNAEIMNVWRPAMMSTLPQNEVFQPYGIANVRLEEGAEVNALVCGVTKQNYPELLEKLAKKEPVKIKARIAPREDYSMVVFDLLDE